jgi:hypothetical protein
MRSHILQLSVYNLDHRGLFYIIFLGKSGAEVYIPINYFSILVVIRTVATTRTLPLYSLDTIPAFQRQFSNISGHFESRDH